MTSPKRKYTIQLDGNCRPITVLAASYAGSLESGTFQFLDAEGELVAYHRFVMSISAEDVPPTVEELQQTVRHLKDQVECLKCRIDELRCRESANARPRPSAPSKETRVGSIERTLRQMADRFRRDKHRVA